MTTPLAVFFTRRAEREAVMEDRWWRENRPAAPDLLARELERALSLLTIGPMLGPAARDVRLRGVRRILLSRTGYHVYYRVQPRKRRVLVLALWSARRGRPPF